MKQYIAELIDRAGLSPIRDQLEDLVVESIRIQTRKAELGELELGASRMGGTPDLPPDFEWPEWKGVPLSFIAQINLADLGQVQNASVSNPVGQVPLFEMSSTTPTTTSDNDLPASGILYFFYSMEQPWGYDPVHRGGCKVIYYGGELSRVQATALPIELNRDDGFYDSCVLTFIGEYTLPSYGSGPVKKLELNNDQSQNYLQLLDALRAAQGLNGPKHRLLGHPDQIQGDMQSKCQLVSHGLYCGDARGYKDARAAELEKGAGDWRLLFQIDTDDTPGMMWGDDGSIYYWIQHEAMAARDFSNVWLILQCY